MGLLGRRPMLRHLLLVSALVGLTACQSSVENPSGEGGHANAGGGGEGGGGAGGSGGTGGSAECAAPASPAMFEIGTGEKCFSRLAASDEVPLLNGPQGGYHVWLAIGCEDCNDPVLLRFGARDPQTGAPFGGMEDLQEMVPLEGAAWPQAAGLTVFMPGLSWDPEGVPPPAKGTHVVLWAEAYDGAELVHQAEVEVIIGDLQEWNPCAEDPDHPSCQFG